MNRNTFRKLIFAAVLAITSAHSFAAVVASIAVAPPRLRVYMQPPCPGEGYIWTPGYWTYRAAGYVWVPGAWVLAPQPGYLFTPGYWALADGMYIWHRGYWGPHVGYYGGVNYGFGFMGVGFAGGEWRGGVFAYNTAVVHVNETVIHNTYVNTTIVHNTTIVNERNVAYSGGPGGIQHQPTPEERIAEHDQHTAPTSFQQQHETSFRSNPQAYAKNNGGHPAVTALNKPLPEEKHTPPPAAPRTQAQSAHSIGSQSGGAGAGKVESHPATSHTTWNDGGNRPGSEQHSTPQNHPTMQNRPAPQNHSAPPKSQPKSEPKPKK